MKRVDFRYEIDGPRNAPPLLLVHGLLSSRAHWLLNLPSLTQHFRTIRIDMPAHGETLMPPDRAALAPARLADALDDLRDHLQIDRWLICGQSVGAGLSLRYAIDYPDRVIGQIFTNANAVLRSYPDEAELAAHAERVARLRDAKARPFDRETIHPRLAKRFPREMRARLARVVESMDPVAFATFIDAVMPHLSLRYELPRNRVPICLINGRFERRFQPLRDWCKAAIPGIEIHDLDGGHSVNIEAPEAFDAAALGFLKRCVKSSYTHM